MKVYVPQGTTQVAARTNNFHTYDYTYTSCRTAAIQQRESDARVLNNPAAEGMFTEIMATVSAFSCRDLVWC